jgi:hypothetical protein
MLPDTKQPPGPYERTELRPDEIRPEATFIDHESVLSRRKYRTFVCESATSPTIGSQRKGNGAAPSKARKTRGLSVADPVLRFSGGSQGRAPGLPTLPDASKRHQI